MPTPEQDTLPEIGLIGDLTDHESDLTTKLLEVPHGGRCTLYIDSPGGSPYSGLSLMSLILLRELRGTAIVTGECSSAALWPFAACQRRIVTPYSVLLFHPMKWQSEEHVGLSEAAEWARHFGHLESEMDRMLAQLFHVSNDVIAQWMKPGRYVSGRELADAGLAELCELQQLGMLDTHGQAPRSNIKQAVSGSLTAIGKNRPPRRAKVASRRAKSRG